MNKFQEIKNILNNQEVVQKYLGLPEKHKSTGNWYKSPFRSEKTASFCVSNKGIHDFGSSKHYDIISFVQEYFNITAKQALEILCRDFGINMQNTYETSKITQMLKQKREEEREARETVFKWHNKELQKICNEIQINRKCLNIFEKQSDFKVLHVLYDEQAKLEYYFEILVNTNEQQKIALYLEGKNDR
ncbi:MAG: hypothetical protein HFJ55_02235 [Clostridia bacterium]|nr:hypothetical protein [Clostridia bacterium]